MEIVNIRQEVFKNILTFKYYRESNDENKRQFYLDRLNAGKTFVADVVEKKIEFVPSRFAGYKNNDWKLHEENEEKHGWITNGALVKIYGAPIEDGYLSEQLQQLYHLTGEPRTLELIKPIKFFFNRETIEKLRSREAIESKLTFKKIAQLTLKAVKKHLTTKEIWYEANRLNIVKDFKSKGKTPAATIGAYIYWSLRDNEGIFTKTEGVPVRFGLVEFNDKDQINIQHPYDINYYLVGTKYYNEKTNSYEDYFEDMIKESVISTGYGWGYNFTHLFNKEDSIIEREVNDKINDLKARSAVKAFLKLRVGDIIGIRDRVRGHIKIRGYAIVVNRNGKTYSFNNNLGHSIEVEYLKTLTDMQTLIGGFVKTISRVTKEDHLQAFFSEYQNNPEKKILNQIRKKRKHKRVATTNRNLMPILRKGTEPCIMNQKHNEIQQMFYEYLSKRYPGKVTMEENFVDIKLILDSKCVLYEVKPYSLPIDCITNALGQILYYSHLTDKIKSIEIVIVGPNEADEEDLQFVNYIKKHLSINFKYEGFNIY